MHSIKRVYAGILPAAVLGAVMAAFMVMNLALAPVAAAQGQSGQAPGQNPGQNKVTLLVKTAHGLSQAEQDAVVTKHGGSQKHAIDKLDLHVIEVPAQAAEAIARNLKKEATVVRVETSQSRRLQGFPSDTLVLSQWALPKIAWDEVYGTATPQYLTKVAILDTGVDATHTDLIGALAPGTSIIDDSTGLTDLNGHGTWLAGIVAARTDNLDGIAGVGFDHVQVMPVKVIDANGLGQDADIIAGVMWAADNGASVILMAFSNPGFSESLQEALDYAWSQGVVLVAAAGNDGSNVATFPAGDRGVMGVSATDETDALAGGSNYGPSVFIAAPGVSILGTGLNNSFVAWSGTSASAAIVAGSAALMRAVDPSLANGVVVSRLARNADPAGTQDETGNGRVQIARAIADTSTDSIQPAGTAPVGDGGPFVGPYTLGATNRTLTYTKAGVGAGTVTFARIGAGDNPDTATAGCTTSGADATCTGSGTFNFKNGDTYRITAAASVGSTFTGWSGQGGSLVGQCSSITNPNPCPTASGSIPLASNSSITATFTGPDLTVAKTNNVSGTVVFPNPWVWTLTVANPGTGAATFTNGQIIVADGIPNTNITYSGLTITPINQTGITGTISCSLSGFNFSCMASGGSVTIAAGTGTFQAQVTATPDAAPQTAANPRSGQTCSVDPNNNIAEGNEANNSCSNTVAVTVASDLTATKTNNVSGSIMLPTNSWTWTVRVQNSGAGIAQFNITDVILRDNLPNTSISYTGLALTNGGLNGTDFGRISCNITSSNLTCSVSTGNVMIPVGAFFDVSFTATASTSATFANPRAAGVCSVDPDTHVTESNEGNNACSNTVIVNPATVNTTTAVSSSLNPSIYGDNVTFTAVVTALSGTTPPSGSVQFKIDAVNFGAPVALAPCAPPTTTTACATSAATSTLTAGNHPVAGFFTHTGIFVDSNGSLSGGQTVGQATVNITASSPTVTYGDPVPTITAAFGPFKNGENSSVLTTQPTCVTAYTTASNVGSFPSTSCSGAVAANYTFTYTPGSVTINQTSSITNVTCTPGPFTYTGLAQTPCSVSVTGAGGLNLTPTPDYLNNTNAGLATASYTFAGDTNHTGSNDSENFTIDPAASITAVTCTAGPFTYTGLAQTPCSVSVTGAGSLNLTPTPTYVNNINAGTATASYTFAGDANHTGSNDSENFTIDAAPTTTTLTCPASQVYTGSPITPCTVLTTGVNGFSVTTATIGYSNNLNVGTANVTATFDAAGNYAASGDTETFAITPAPTTTTLTCPASQVYTGSPITPCTVLTTGVNGFSVTTATIGYSNNLNVGTANVIATFDASGNYAASGDTETFAITPAPTTTTLTCPATQVYTGSAITPCTVLTTGVNGFSVTTATIGYSNNLNVGTANVIATFDASGNYAASGDTETFAITPAPTTTTLTCPATQVYTGSAITPCTVLTTGVNGFSVTTATIGYTNNLNVGTANVIATFDASGNYAASGDTETFAITPAPTTTTLTCPASQVYTGSPITPCTVLTTGVNGFSVTTATIGYTNNLNVGTANVIATFDASGNYAASGDTETFAITPAPTTTTLTCPASQVYTGSPITPCTVLTTGVNGFSVTTATIGYSNNLNVGTANVIATFDASGNYAASGDTETFAITPAPTTTTLTCPASQVYTGSPITPCTVLTTGVNGFSVTTATIGYSNNLNVGTANVTATFDAAGNYAASGDTETFAITPAPTTTTLTCPASQVYTGSPITPCTVLTTGVNGFSVTTATIGYSNNLNVGTANVTATFDAAGNYAASGDTETFAITPAPSTVTVTCTVGAPYTYTGLPQTPCTAKATGVGMTDVDVSASLSYLNNTNAGSATASANWGGDANHTGNTGNGGFVIDKKLVTPAITAANKVYDGYTTATLEVPNGCTVSPVISPDTVACTSSTISFDNKNVGTRTATATGITLINNPAGNYKLTTYTATDNAEITQATPTVTSTGGAFTYNGSPRAGSGVATGIPADGTLALAPAPTLTYSGTGSTVYGPDSPTAPTNAGTYEVTAHFAGNLNYIAKDSTPVALTINTKAASVTPANNSKLHGDSDPSLTGTLYGFLVADGVTATYSRALGEAVSPPTYLISATLSANPGLLSNYNITYNTGTFTINKRPTILTYNGPFTAYSGQCTVNVSATLKDGVTSAGIAGESVMITIGTQTFGPFTTNASGVASGTVTITQPLGPVSANAGYAGSSIYAVSSTANSSNFTIIANPNVGGLPNQAIYTGSLFFWTTGPSSSTSTLTLSATIRDTDPVCIGDIRKAKVTFAVRNGTTLTPIGNNTSNLPVGLVNTADTEVGTASAITQYSIGSGDVQSLQVGVIVGGNFYAMNSTATDTMVTIAKPGVANSMVGGGALNNAAPNASNGYLAGATGPANNTTFSTNVKYNKSGTNPQGKVNIIIKSHNRADGTPDPDLNAIHTYSITSSSITELTLPQPNKASFGSKANVVEITNPNAPVSLEGGAMLQMTVTNGSTDSASIVVQRKLGGVWFSSAWNGVATVEKPLVSGDVAIQ